MKKTIRRTIQRFSLLCCTAVILIILLFKAFYRDSTTKISLPWNNLHGEILSLPLEEHFDHDKSIFFIESFGKNYIPGRFLCSIESAARIHKNMFIDVMMTSPKLRKSEGIKSLLKAYSNIRFFHLNATTLYLETTLKEWFLQEKWKLTKYPEINFGDVLRFLLLYKYGGIYLDMDVIVLKNLTEEDSFLGLETNSSINNAVMGFRKGHPFLRECIEEIPKPFNTNLWGVYGPLLITEILKRRCHAEPPKTALKNCPDIRLYKREVFYPLDWLEVKKIFEEDQEFTRILLNHPDFLALHIWNVVTKKFIISLEGQSILSLIARNSCPITAFVHDYKFNI